MGKYTFYYPDGAEIVSMEEFIKFYSRMYYYLDHNFKLEAKMEKLLKRDPKRDLNRNDLSDILSWKTGGTFNEDEGNVITRYYTINTGGVLEAYEAWKSYCRENSYSGEKAFDELLRQLKKHDVTGIGPVIAITIMYYDSCGEYPIYDRFADIAVQFILERKEFPKTLTSKMLSTTAEKAYDQYQKYCTKLKKIFEGCYEDTDRDIDRALWVYGHMFSKNKTNEKNEKEFGSFKEWRQQSGR